MTSRIKSILSDFPSSSRVSELTSLARKHALLTMAATATTVVATAGLAAASAGPARAAGPGTAGDVPAALHVGADQSLGALAAGHTAASGTGGLPATAAGASHHPAKRARLAVADHGTNRHQRPASHVTVIRHHAAPARHSGSGGHAAPPKRPGPYLVYDSITPSALPSKHVAAAYATGGYAASPSQLAGHKKVIWIDTNGSDPAASALDVEPGDATPAQAATWAFHRLRQHPHALAIIYTMRSEWSATQQAIGGLPHHMQDHVRWWIADPTGSPHVVPGSAATQWYWGSKYDVTTATPRF